jgi:hypothetical protein
MNLTNEEYTCYSGGAQGADMAFEMYGALLNVKIIAYSFKGHKTKSMFRKILTKAELQEGWKHILIAAKTLKRNIKNVSDYTQKLLARDYYQAKNADAIFAISKIIKPGELGNQYINKSNIEVVDGGTGYCVQCAINMNKPVYVFNMKDNNWYNWDYIEHKFIRCNLPKLTKNFAGIGSRQITKKGIEEIKNLYENS